MKTDSVSNIIKLPLHPDDDYTIMESVVEGFSGEEIVVTWWRHERVVKLLFKKGNADEENRANTIKVVIGENEDQYLDW